LWERLKNTILANSFASALIVTTSQAVNALMSLYAMQYFQASKLQLGYLFTLFFLTSAFSKILAGIFVSQRYLKYIFLTGTLLISLSIAMYDVVPTLELLYLFRVVHGIGFAFANTACLTIASLIVEEGLQSYSVSMVTAFNAIGLILGPLVGTFGTLFFDIPTTFAIVSIIALIAFLFTLYISKGVKLKDSGVSKVGLKDFLFLKEKWFTLNTMAYFAYALIYGTIISYIPAYVKQYYGLNDYSITALFFIFFILSLVSRVVLLKRNDFEFLKGTLSFSLGLSILMIALVGLPSPFEIFITEFALIGLGHGFIYPITAVFISKYSPSGKRFMVNTVYFTSFDFGNAVGPLIASALVTFLPLNLVFLGTAILPSLLFTYVALNLRHLKS